MRREGRVPAVIYGNKQEALSIHVEEKALMKMLNTGHFMNSVIMVDGVAGAAIRTIPKDVHFHPVTDRPMHVDFLRISEHATITVSVPVVFVDQEESKGIKRGGVLNIVQHEVDLVCDASEIPGEITISLAGVEVGDSIHISNVTLPNGVTPAITDRDFTIATMAAPTIPNAEDEAADEALAAEQSAAAEAEAAAEKED
ncbi:50S ribosomal protein L25 [Sphingomonas prati]|nr:50S ribosomal protein L25 [Sphingomonas prati]